MAEPFYTAVLRVLHVGGGWLAFGIAPLALFALKGSRHHVLAGRGFLVSMSTGITAGLVLAVIDSARGLFLFGLLMLFFLGTGYLAPRIGRGSRRWYRWDRVLTALGAVGSLGLIGDGLGERVLAWSDIAFGGIGLVIVATHAGWRGPRDPSRWQVEHLTSLVAAYAVAWNFILAQYIRGLPEAARVAVPVLGIVAIVWARRHFGRARTDRDAAAPVHGAA